MSGKRAVKALLMLILLICMVLGMSSCTPEYETITQNPGNHKYTLGEKVEIIDIETSEVIATLTLESCEVADAEPFTVVEKRGSDDEYSDTEYTALYKIDFSFSDEKNEVLYASQNFRSDDKNFEINPSDRRESNNCVYVGAKAGNNGDDVMSLAFVYDIRQMRNTAEFDIKLDEIVAEDRDAHSKIIVIDGEDDGEKASERTQTLFSGGIDAIAVIFVLLILIIVFAAPVLGIIGFFKSIGKAKKIKLCMNKIQELEQRLAVAESRIADAAHKNSAAEEKTQKQ